MTHDKTDPGNWVRLADYIRSGKSPIDMRWLVFHRREAMRQFGCLLKLGKGILIDHERLMAYLEELDRREEGIVPKLS